MRQDNTQTLQVSITWAVAASSMKYPIYFLDTCDQLSTVNLMQQ